MPDPPQRSHRGGEVAGGAPAADSTADAAARNRQAAASVHDTIRHIRLLVELSERLTVRSAAMVTATRRRHDQLRRLGIAAGQHARHGRVDAADDVAGLRPVSPAP
jgi:beta-phosphoglucomutase-like phosphatase (HAD superfamily)